MKILIKLLFFIYVIVEFVLCINNVLFIIFSSVLDFLKWLYLNEIFSEMFVFSVKY